MPICQCSDTVLASQQLVNRQKLESSIVAFIEACTSDIGQLANRNSTRQQACMHARHCVKALLLSRN